MGNKERQAEMDTRQEKEKALWRQLEQTDTAKETQLKHNEKKKGNHVTTRHLTGDLLYRKCRDTKSGFYLLRPLTISWPQSPTAVPIFCHTDDIISFRASAE